MRRKSARSVAAQAGDEDREHGNFNKPGGGGQPKVLTLKGAKDGDVSH